MVLPINTMASGEASTLLRRRWDNLLDWLEGHGFQAQSIPVECRETAYAGNGLFARGDCTPGSLMFEVPPKVLMNKMTLKRLYPPNTRVDKALTAVQLISMHLFIWRPKADQDSADPAFGPYISNLPRDFDSHPLTWLVLSRLDEADKLRTSLLDSLPPSVLAALHHVHTRFWDDWCNVQTFLKTPSMTHMVRVPPSSFEKPGVVVDFLWAWLNVNTRCIHYRLKHSIVDPDNLTMCPVLDLANHTLGLAHMIPVPSKSEIRNAAPVNPVGDGLKFISSNYVKVEKDDEILLTYGLHSNKTLFVEYGFVNFVPGNGPPPSGEIDVQDLAEKYVLADVRLGEAIRLVLLTEGYWGDWTLHSSPDNAQPSWRLITALRLYHLVVAVGSTDESSVQPWRDVTAGKRHRVSCENEQSWRKTVVLLCDLVIERAEKSIACDPAQNRYEECAWARWMSGNIQSLWREELFVAGSVKECILRGDEF